jgi:uncharacterized protein
MRVFLDANILFSAAKSGGATRALIELALRRGHQCWADPFVIEEARRNLARKWTDQQSALEALLGRLQVGGSPTSVGGLAASLPLPDKDRPVLLAAIHNRCEWLVTGDRTHFGKLYGKALHGVTIVSPRQLAETIITREK